MVNAVAIQQVNRDYSDSFFRSIDIQMEQMQREFSEMDRQVSDSYITVLVLPWQGLSRAPQQSDVRSRQ